MKSVNALGKQALGRSMSPDEAGGTHRLAYILWIIGAVVLLALCVLMKLHPASFPFELSFTNFIQGPHPVPCKFDVNKQTWVDAASGIIDRLNDPIYAVALPGIWAIGLALFRRIWEGLFLAAAVGTSSLIWFLLETVVGRPRMTPVEGVCVHRVIGVYSFPSGHVTHDVTFYGFLLFLSFMKPVREWRYRWLLVPLQIIAALYIIAVGYARIEVGEHHLVDVLGGYLLGTLWFCLFIFLYHRTMKYLATRRARKGIVA